MTDTRSSSALFKRAEQLQRWEESDTNKQSPAPKQASRIQFSSGIVFLAACTSGDKDEVQRLLKAGADINTANVDGLTALHQACIDDNLDMVEFLVEHGADVNRGDNEGWTPLHATASCGFLSIARSCELAVSMEEDSTSNAVEDLDLPLVEVSTSAESPAQREASTSSEGVPISSTTINNDESGVGLDSADDCNKNVTAESLVEHEPCEPNDDARLLGDLDSLPAGDDLVLGASGSDSGVEGCGGGSRSCASSVVSCGSGCGSESSSVAGAPPRLRRRVNVTVTEPKRSSPFGSSTPRPVTAPRGPNLATRKRARSREKPTSPEKPRPLTPKPRIRPTGELPNLVRESPALRAKPTKTSTARCRTPNSPSEEKRWPSNGPRLTTVTDPSATRVAADKYGTLPRRRRENGEPDGSPKHDITPPTSRRPTITRSVSTRTATKGRVRIYAENNSQTVLIGADVESALAGVVPNIEFSREITRSLVRRCHRGVQASARDTETTRLAAAAAAAEAAAAEERERRQHAEAQLAAERAARLAAIAELDRNSQRLLKLAGPGAGAGAEGCLRTLEEQLRSAGELAARQRGDIDALREHCDRLHHEACSARESGRVLQARLAEAECEMAEMQDFLAAETGALGDSLREVEAEVAMVNKDRKRRRAECRQLVRMCEQRRQEALGAAARARSGGGAAHALDALGRRLARLTDAVPRHALEPQVYHNDAFSRSDSGEALSPDEERGGLLTAVARALRSAPAPPAAPAPDDDRSRVSDDNDNSADLLDSETEPCLVTDPECAEEWWSGAEAGGAWSGEELSPERESIDAESTSERDSLRNLSAAIANRHRSEAEDAERGTLLERVLALDNRLSEFLRALRLAAAAAAVTDDANSMRLAQASKDKIDVSEKNVTDVVVKKLAELDASKNMMDQYRQSVEALKKQLAQAGEEDDLNFIEEEQPAPSVLSRCAGAGHLPAPAPRRVARLQAAADDSMSDRRSLLSIASGIYEEIPDLPEQLYTKMSRHDAPDGPTCGNETKSDKCKTEVERVIRLEKPTYAPVEECVYATMRRTGKRCPPPPLQPRLPFGTMKLGESWNSRMNTDAVTRHSSLGYSVSSTSSDCKTKILPKYRQAFSVFRKCLKSDSRIMSPKSETAKENKDVETKKKKFDFTPTRDIFKNFKVSRKMKNLKIAPGSLSKAGETKSCEFLDETDHVTTARCSKSIECLENDEFDDFDADLSLEFNDDFVTSLALPQEIVDLILRREQMNMIRLKSEMSESDYLPMSPICPPTPVEYHYVVMSPSTNLA